MLSVNKKELVYENLKSRIIENKLKPGKPLIETDYALELGVSKTPVRKPSGCSREKVLLKNVMGRGSIVTYIINKDTS